eukprot:GILJ01011965.1.p2 GENE.GILJ01011965.1~~GILJ01011965.1.p2  ORF type:complete len:259 (-),score=39.58 GILJ01011965.1:688-1464(-)
MGHSSSSLSASVLNSVSSSTVQHCSTNNTQIQSGLNITVDAPMNCAGGIDIMSQNMTVDQTCISKAVLDIIQKAAADNTASAKAMLGMFSESDTNTTIENRINTLVEQQCGASNLQSLANSTVKITQPITSDGMCSIGLQALNAKTACMLGLLQTASQEGDQKTKSEATGQDIIKSLGDAVSSILGSALLFPLIGLVVLGIVLLIFGKPIFAFFKNVNPLARIFSSKNKDGRQKDTSTSSTPSTPSTPPPSTQSSNLA